MVLLSKMLSLRQTFTFFFFNDTATTEIYTLSLHDALPISRRYRSRATYAGRRPWKKTSVWSLALRPAGRGKSRGAPRSEEHTSELQSQSNLVCRLLLEKKKNTVILFRAYPRR